MSSLGLITVLVSSVLQTDGLTIGCCVLYGSLGIYSAYARLFGSNVVGGAIFVGVAAIGINFGVVFSDDGLGVGICTAGSHKAQCYKD